MIRATTHWFRDASIKRKLNLVGLLTVGFALLAVSLILTARDIAEWRARAVSDLTAYARVIGANAASAMLFDDQKAAGETLSALANRPDIAHAVIFDVRGREFAAYRAASHGHEPMLLLDHDEHRFGLESLFIASPIRAHGETMGTIVLEMGLAGLYAGILRSIGLIFLVALGTFLVTALLFAKLQRTIVAPILDLAAAMQSVSARQDYTVRVSADRGDEVGLLARTFNETLESIRARDAQLAQYRQHLEDEVASRTTELAHTNAQLERELAERRTVQSALRDSEERFRAISASAQDAVIMLDNAGCVSYWNAAAEKIFGYASAEVLGEDMHALLAPQRFHAAYQLGFAHFRSTGEGPVVGKTVELSARGKNGAEFPMELSLSAVKLGGVWSAVGIARDVSERNAADAEHRKLSEALRQSQEAVIVADPDLRFAYVNPAFTALFGYAAADVVGQPLSLLAPPPDSRFHNPAEVARAARAQGAFHGEVLRRAKNGSLIAVLLNVAPVRNEDDAIVSYVATMSDLTDLKRAEAEVLARVDELTRLNDKLSQAQNQLMQSEKMASIGLLAAGVAHEINNPVGYIKSNLQTLGKYVSDFQQILAAYGQAEARIPMPEQAFAEVRQKKQAVDFDYETKDIAQLLAESNDGIERVTKIIQDLKEFSRIDTKEEWCEEDIHRGLESTLNVVWNQLKYTCEVKKEYGTLPPVECLASQLNQVFMNLLVNAAQAIEAKGTITIRTGTEGDRVWIEVADTGKGIAPENLQRIFDPFFTTKPVGKGTGLGLSVSYGIIQKHHGSIEVESEFHRGTTFRVWLPVRQPATDNATEGGDAVPV